MIDFPLVDLDLRGVVKDWDNDAEESGEEGGREDGGGEEKDKACEARTVVGDGGEECCPSTIATR